MNNKVVSFVSLLIIGLIIFILSVFVFRIDETPGMIIAIIGALCIIGGAFGSCIYSKVAREIIGEIFGGLLELICG